MGQFSVSGNNCPQWPKDGFADLNAARSWVRDFIHWCNEHRHSRIRFVTPAQRHRGEDQEVLAKRHALYQRARNQHRHRWSGATRNWQPIGAVTLNPDREQSALKIAA
jgi:putative transposase